MTNRKFEGGIVWGLVFFGGFANLAMEIIGPRMFASIYGTATSIWAIIISVTLVGLSAGYALGGRVSVKNVRTVIPLVLVANAAWLLAISWIVWMVPASSGASFNTITTTAMFAFFPPSTLFGMVTPMCITLRSEGLPPDEVTPIVGNLYALGTIGSVMGALTAAYFWIPWVGLSLSLRLFAIGLLLFAAYFAWERRFALAGVAALAIIVPQPGWEWNTDDGLDLVAQREGYYQTVRVYGDDETRQMHLGPTFHSKIDLETGEPLYSYADNLLRLADGYSADMTGMDVVIIGGAGHALGNAFEERGATVTEVEIDPVVAEMSDAYFYPIDGEVMIEDGRVFVETAPSEAYDVFVLDAFDGGAGVPPQLSTLEFYESVERVLKPDGLFLYNFIGTPQGRLSASYDATGRTIDAAFPSAGALTTRDDLTDRQNIIFAASPSDTRLDDLLTPLSAEGALLTDDRNPIEILNGRSREGIYFRR